MLSVARHHAAALLDLSIQMPQVAKSHRRLEFIHLGVGADRVHNDLIADSEILKTVQVLLQSALLSVKAYSAALDRMEHLRCVEAEHGRIPERRHTASLVRNAKRMRRIVNHFQMMLFGDRLDRLHITEIAVDMHRYDRAGLVRDQRLDLGDVHRVVLRIHITEYRRQPVPHDRMCCGRKRKRRGNDFPRQMQCLDQKLQRHVSIGKKGNMIHLQILFQFFFQFIVLRPHICQPVAVPDILNLFYIFFILRHGRTCYQYSAHFFAFPLPQFSAGAVLSCIFRNRYPVMIIKMQLLVNLCAIFGAFLMIS